MSMNRFKSFFLRNMCLLASVALIGGGVSALIAGPCYQNTAYGQAANCTLIGQGNVFPVGPCPRYPDFQSLPRTVQCGCIFTSNAVPTSSTGNNATGTMNYTGQDMTCASAACCTATTVMVQFFPPLFATACSPGTAFPTHQAWVGAAATGPDCPQSGS